MKNRYSLLALLGLGIWLYNPAYAQLKQEKSLSPVKGTAQHFAQYSLASFSPNLQHQHDDEPCVTDALTEEWIHSYGIEERYRQEEQQQAIMAQEYSGGDRSTYTVPIIFHVIHNPASPAENVSASAIYALLDAVNEDFNMLNADVVNARTALGFTPSNANIEFCLAQRDPSGNQLAEIGIHRVATTEDYYNPDTEANKMKDNTGGGTGTPVWNRNNYINVWICDITNGATSGVAGYAYKPTVSTLPPASIDGIVIDYNLGMVPSNRVLTHELGHYFGLSHTWGAVDGGGCSTNDGLSDTPNTAGPSFNYPLSCSGLQQTCSGINTQYENYMDYSSCQVMYTAQQTNLMEMVLTGSRNSLNSSNACVPVNPVPPVTDFVADITTVIQGGSVNFTDLSTNFPTSWSWSFTPSTGITYLGGTTSSSQNPTVQFANTGTYTVTLTATNGVGSDTETKTSYINVVSSGGGTTACDTLRNYSALEKTHMTAYGVTGGDGYFPGNLFLPGTNDFQLYNVCDSFYTSTPTQVRRIYLPVFQADDMGAASNVTFTVWNNNGATSGPGAVLGTQVVPISNLNAGQWNEITFSTPVSVNGEFWVGYQLSYAGALDTVIFATTLFADRPSGQGTTWVQGYEPNLSAYFMWQSVTSFFTSHPNSSLVLDVLTSNGPAPTAVVSFPVTETCEGMDVTMNGYGSTNTTSYYWDISDGTNDYYYDQANLTTNAFTQGNWTIQLQADGSCKTALSPVYNLTVNPPINVTPTITPENCTAADGSISMTATGGDGGPYNYSINTGATFQPTGSFTGLIAGNYNVVITDNHNCELNGVATVTNNNTFNPTITPDATIPPGQNTALTVTGGVTWTWYEGVDIIGSTNSINVAPTVTTTYICNVVDASGCEAELEVTLTVINDAGIEENLADGLSLYPNPTTGKFAITFDLSASHDMQIEVVNIIGEKVISKTFTGVQNQTFEFDANTFSDGVYFVVIRSEDQTISKKLVVRK